VDAESIAIAALSQLADAGVINKRKVKKAIKKYQINDVTAADAGNTEGSG
jgi:pyruvate dehydrogenase E1 component